MRKIIRNLDKPLLFITTILFILGLVMVFSASYAPAFMAKDASPYSFFIKQAIFMAIGIFLSCIFINIKVKKIGIYSCLGVVLILIAQALLPFFGVLRNNSRSWFDFGFMSFQPSEFMKVITIFWLSYYYDKNRKKLNVYSKVLYPIFITLVSAFLIFIEPDLGTMVIYGSIVGVVFLAQPISAKIKIKTIFLVGGLAVIALIIYAGTGHNILIARQRDRINAGKPCDNLLTTGNQICNGYIAINNGGLTGVGLGASTQKYLYLPEPYTDFIFCIIVEELGLLTGIAIILMYMFLLFRILYIGRKSSNNIGATICYGVAFYIFIHIAVNLLGLFGLMPMTGVPLPFMSYGGSFTLCLMVALTIVQRVNIENKGG